MTDDARDPNYWEDGSPVPRPDPSAEPQLRPDPAIDVWLRSQVAKLQDRVATLEDLLMAATIIEPDGETYEVTEWQQKLQHAFNADEFDSEGEDDLWDPDPHEELV